MWCWSSHVQVTSLGVESMFSWSYLKTIGIMSSSNALVRCVRFWGHPEGSAAELPDGSLKLWYCTTVLAEQFPLWVLPRLSGGIGNRRVVTSGNLLDCGGNFGKRVPLTRKIRPGACSFVNPDPGHSTPRRWRRLLLLGSSRQG